MEILYSIFLVFSTALGLPQHTMKHCELRVSASTEYGAVCGVQRAYSPVDRPGTDFVSFLNVPYSEQPLGKLRFAELPPPKPWKDFLNATVEGPVCPQHDVAYRGLANLEHMDEACLHANVYVPFDAIPGLQEQQKANGTSSRLRPVLVFVHGGGFGYGSGDPDFNGPEYLMEQGVVVVTFNYRLNVFGFLSLNTSHIPGNAGLRDQVNLLKWVRRNVQGFGGDPHDITLMGHSTGASSAHILSLSPAAEGLFERVVLLSGTSTRAYFSTSPKYAHLIASRFLEILGVDTDDPDEIFHQLIEMPAQQINAANKKLLDQTGLFAFTPVVESNHEGVTPILTDYPEKLMRYCHGNALPMLLGFTEDEGQTFRRRLEAVNMAGRMNRNSLLKVPATLLYSEHHKNMAEIISRVDARYFWEGDVTIDNLVKYYSDYYFAYPAMHVASVRAAIGAAPTFLYQFSYEGLFRVLQVATGLHFHGTSHAEDLTYILRTNSLDKPVALSRSLYSKDGEMQVSMTSLLVNFMVTSDPTGYAGGRRRWRPVDYNGLQYQDLRTPHTNNMKAPSKDQAQTCHFFDHLYDYFGTLEE